MSTFCTFETEYRLTRIDQSLRRLSLSFTRCNSRIPRDLFGCHLSVSQWTHAVTRKPHPANLRPFVCPRNGSFLTRRWREGDSNPRSQVKKNPLVETVCSTFP